MRLSAGSRPSIKFLRHFIKDDAGVSGIFFALVLPVIIGIAGLSTEVGLWYSQKRYLQTAADAAAMGAAWQVFLKSQGQSPSDLTDVAAADARRNGVALVGDDGAGSSIFQPATIEVFNPPKSGTYAGNDDAVEVYLTQPQNTLFSRILTASKSQNIQVRGVASLIEVGQACILALETITADAVKIGGNMKIDLTSCGIFANSSNAKAIDIFGNASVTADFIKTVGNYYIGGSASVDVPDGEVLGSQPSVADPFAGTPVPTPPAGSPTISGNTKVQPNSTQTLQPGTYNGMDLQGTVNLAPGVYKLTGDLKIDSQAIVNGTGVTFVMTNGAAVTINGGATVNLSAPDTGKPGAGMVFYQTGSDTSVVHKFNGGSTMNITGAMYFPTQTVSFNGGDSTLGNNSCSKLVARVIYMVGDANFGAINCKGDADHPLVYNPTLVE